MPKNHSNRIFGTKLVFLPFTESSTVAKRRPSLNNIMHRKINAVVALFRPVAQCEDGHHIKPPSIAHLPQLFQNFILIAIMEMDDSRYDWNDPIVIPKETEGDDSCLPRTPNTQEEQMARSEEQADMEERAQLFERVHDELWHLQTMITNIHNEYMERISGCTEVIKNMESEVNEISGILALMKDVTGSICLHEVVSSSHSMLSSKPKTFRTRNRTFAPQLIEFPKLPFSINMYTLNGIGYDVSDDYSKNGPQKPLIIPVWRRDQKKFRSWSKVGDYLLLGNEDNPQPPSPTSFELYKRSTFS
jgi:hypothetical protein